MSAPTRDRLRIIQSELGYTQCQMAELVGYPKNKKARNGALISDGSHWRKHTAHTDAPHYRPLSESRQLHMALSLALPRLVERVHKRNSMSGGFNNWSQLIRAELSDDEFRMVSEKHEKLFAHQR